MPLGLLPSREGSNLAERHLPGQRGVLTATVPLPTASPSQIAEERVSTKSQEATNKILSEKMGLGPRGIVHCVRVHVCVHACVHSGASRREVMPVTLAKNMAETILRDV